MQAIQRVLVFLGWNSDKQLKEPNTKSATDRSVNQPCGLRCVTPFGIEANPPPMVLTISEFSTALRVTRFTDVYLSTGDFFGSTHAGGEHSLDQKGDPIV